MVQDGKNEVKEALSINALHACVYTVFTSDSSALLGPMLWFIDLTVATQYPKVSNIQKFLRQIEPLKVNALSSKTHAK